MIDNIKSLLEEGVKKEHFPGAHFLVVYKDGRTMKDFVGYKELYPTKILNTGNEIYDCASLTKVISTTTMIMKLIEENKLSLETEVFDILKRFKHKGIKIKHLLTHTSGLKADVRNSYLMSTNEDVLSAIYSSELQNEIGKHIVYSDIGYMLLGEIIKTLTNKELNEYAEEVIFSKLGMNDTGYRPDVTRCAPTEYRDDDVYKGYLRGKVHDEKAYALNGLAGHAGLFSTVDDIGKFILSFLRNDESVLKKETVDSLFVLRAKEEREKRVPLVRSYGFDKPTIGGTAGDYVSFEDTIVHTGFTGCNLWIDRLHGVGFVMLSNAVHPKREMNNIIQYRNKIGNMIIPGEKDERNV